MKSIELSIRKSLKEGMMATKISPIVKAKQDLAAAQKAVAARQKKYDSEAKVAKDALNLDMLGLTASVAAAKAVVDALTAQANAVAVAKVAPRIVFEEVAEPEEAEKPAATPVPEEEKGFKGILKGMGLR